MSNKIEKGVLAQHWIHSHEEDNDTEMIFRPSSYKFAPSRGRTSFDLKPDGSLTESGPGATDRTEQSEGRWQLDANKNLVFYYGSGGERPSRVLRLASADRNRLVIKK
jgi:hypothetical protein